MRNQRDPGKVLHGFHFHIGARQVFAVSHDSVVRHEYRVVLGHERLECVGQFRRPRRAVLGERNAAEPDHHLTDQRLGQGTPRCSESGSGGRVCVHNSLHVGAQFVNQQMHADFAGNVAASGQLAAFSVNDHQVGGTHSAFAYGRGSNQDTAAVQTNREIAVGGSDEAALMQHAAEIDNFLPIVAFAGH